MQIIIKQPFTSEVVSPMSLVGNHSYKVQKRGTQDQLLRVDYITAISGVSLKLVVSVLEAEEGDTGLCGEISFEVDGDYDRVPSKGIKVRATKWLLSVWKDVQSDFVEFYCDPHDADGHLSYRLKVFRKLGFVDDHGMLVFK